MPFDGVNGIDGLSSPIEVEVSPVFRLLIVYGGGDNSLSVFSRNILTGELAYIRTIRNGNDNVVGMDCIQNTTFSPDNNNIYVTSASEDIVSIFNIEQMDYSPPEITVSVTPAELWPVNHKMVEVTASISVGDDTDPNPAFSLKNVYASENDEIIGSGNEFDDIDGANTGTDDRSFSLCAERSGRSDSRIYTIIYKAEDSAGNASYDTAFVNVKHDNRKIKSNLAGDVFAPDKYSIAQNFPNPFNPETTIRYQIPISGTVTLEILNSVGQKIRTLVSSNQPAGVYSVTWNGKNDSEIPVSSGMYFYGITAGSFTDMKKMILLK